MKKGAPVFVKIDEYRDVLDLLHLLKDKISEAHSILGKLNTLKQKEDEEIAKWGNGIDVVEKKVLDIDKMLLEVNDI